MGLIRNHGSMIPYKIGFIIETEEEGEDTVEEVVVDSNNNNVEKKINSDIVKEKSTIVRKAEENHTAKVRNQNLDYF